MWARGLPCLCVNMYSAVYIGYNIGHRKVVILNQCMESGGGWGGTHVLNGYPLPMAAWSISDKHRHKKKQGKKGGQSTSN